MLARRRVRRGSTRWLPLGLALLVGLALGAAGMRYLPAYLPRPQPTGLAVLPPPPSVEALGRLQPLGGVISVFGPPGDRIEKLADRAAVGQKVNAKDVLVVLASKSDREAERDLAQKQLDEALALRTAIQKAWEARQREIDAELAQIESNRIHDVKVQKAKIEVHDVQHQNAVAAWKRRESLQLTPFTKQEQEQYQGNLKQLEGELNAARIMLSKTEASYEHAKKVAEAKRQTAALEVSQALERVPVGSLRLSRDLAQRRVDATSIKSPVSGTVLRIVTREGDTIGAQPILQMADLDRMAVVAEVPPEEVSRLRAWLNEGAVAVTLESRAMPGATLTGTLRGEDISQLVARNSILSLDPRADTDPRMVEVRVELDDSQGRAARYVGLDNVRVKFAPGNPSKQ